MKLNCSYPIVLVALIAAKSFSAGAQTNSAAAPDYSSFSKNITERNIFDPTRRPHVPYVPGRNVAPPRTANSFTFVGTMDYGEGNLAGNYAFFDGSSSQYRKAAKLDDSIGVFKITAIEADAVTLVQDTNTTVLRLGEQMHDDAEGRWQAANVSSFSSSGGGGYMRNSGRNTFGGGNRRRDNNNGPGNNFGNNNPGGDQNNQPSRFTQRRPQDTRGPSDRPQPGDRSQPGDVNTGDGMTPQIIIIPSDTVPAQPIPDSNPNATGDNQN